MTLQKFFIESSDKLMSSGRKYEWVHIRDENPLEKSTSKGKLFEKCLWILNDELFEEHFFQYFKWIDNQMEIFSKPFFTIVCKSN